MGHLDDLDDIASQFRYGGNGSGRVLTKKQRSIYRRAIARGAIANRGALAKQQERSINRPRSQADIVKRENQD